MRLKIIIVLTIVFSGCRSQIDDFLKNYPSSLSPDKNAIVYQTSFPEDGAYRVSLGTWIETDFGNGGAGIFDIQLDTIEDLKFNWLSDTSILVVYPPYAKVLRQDTITFFGGRNIHISYEVDQIYESKDEVIVELEGPSLLVVGLDSLELEAVKMIEGEDIFYTAADDLMWYNSLLLDKMDSLKIPVKYFNQNKIKVIARSETYRITKDSTFSIYTYFFYDSKSLIRKDLFELL